MSFYRKLVAHCDGKDITGSTCFTAATLNPNTTQPYRDLLDLGWTVSPDGEEIYCPKTHKDVP